MTMRGDSAVYFVMWAGAAGAIAGLIIFLDWLWGVVS